MTVADVLAVRREMWDEPAVVEGHLIVTSEFSYLAAGLDETRGVLVHEPQLRDRLLASVPPMGGSLVLYAGTASVEGMLRLSTGLPMFPAMLYSIRAVVYRQRGWEPTRLEFVEPGIAPAPLRHRGFEA